MVSFLIWQVYGEYICHRSSKQLNKSRNIQLVLFLCFRPKNMHFRLSVRCLLGVWWVSGGCQGPSGLCLGCINAKSIGKGLVDIILNKYRIFSQWPIFGQKGSTDPIFRGGW